ncbi:MAG: hypothetical protein P8K68_12180 [Algibacter sp.]|uniref:hypothetical protein n=1 Tax=Algibacter sp. TaxID=1872428 RepID=UPI0026109E2B|nr:hypothetical protein [Algibacter sp.]MDG1729649.1 hypothetical protein [Algibacter sp.]MDG2179525.1 hypothetical protein [Algibacter sp.]
MKYLTPEIEALSKNMTVSKSLARTNVSCGIFQDCDYTEERPKLYHQQRAEEKESSK